ncbi:uncharacterized protein LOC111261000 isoform X3 [Varroa jacobsoni]|uniref:uncharacterized protein LOC111261000 isoform X3 n=1 Tax=Varroa jacobsoni TaxID=62625 RepID=UPI000BF50187|nr:uncharacterized protein LOC111261000 isoform X3 [Varroa jacobsoni]
MGTNVRLIKMTNRMTTRVDPRTQHGNFVKSMPWYDDIFIAPQISLAVFGIHITYTPEKRRVFNLFWRRLVTTFIAALNLAYLVENIMAMAAGLNHWHHVKWLMTSVTAVFTMGYIFINLNKVRDLVVFYRINYNSWCSSEKRSVRIKVSSMIPIIWLVVLGAGGDYALYAQLRNLFHHQEANLSQLDELFSSLVLFWYLMCTINVIANIHLIFEGSFPGFHACRIIFNLFMECFPWYAIVWGSTGAAEGIRTEFYGFVKQLEQTVTTLNGKNLQAPLNRSAFSMLLWMQRTTFCQPKITLAGWLPIRRNMLLALMVFFILYVGVVSLSKSSMSQ